MSQADQHPLEVSEETFLAKRKLRAEIRNLQALTQKTTIESKNAEVQYKELIRKRAFYERILSTTQFTIVLALFTLLFQIVQFGYTARETRAADENKQWKDAVREVSFDGDSKAVSGALDLETFFMSKTYSGEAKQLVASVLPYIKDNNAFDHLTDTLLKYDGWNDPGAQVYTVAKSIAVAYGQLAEPMYENSKLPVAAQNRYRDELSNQMLETIPSSDPRVMEAQRREWEIDTVTRGLLDFWNRNGTRPPDAPASYSADLQTIMLRLDGDGLILLRGFDFSHAYLKGAYLHKVDFSESNLSSATLIDTDLGSAKLNKVNLDHARIDGANLDNVNEFDGSSWKGVEWWKAARLSPSLCRWLGKNGEQSGPPAPLQNSPSCDPGGSERTAKL